MTAPAPLAPGHSRGALAMIGGPDDGATHALAAGAELPDEIRHASGEGAYVRMQAVPGWLHRLPPRPFATTFYVWEHVYVV